MSNHDWRQPRISARKSTDDTKYPFDAWVPFAQISTNRVGTAYSSSWRQGKDWIFTINLANHQPTIHPSHSALRRTYNFLLQGWEFPVQVFYLFDSSSNSGATDRPTSDWSSNIRSAIPLKLFDAWNGWVNTRVFYVWKRNIRPHSLSFRQFVNWLLWQWVGLWWWIVSGFHSWLSPKSENAPICMSMNLGRTRQAIRWWMIAKPSLLLLLLVEHSTARRRNYMERGLCITCTQIHVSGVVINHFVVIVFTSTPS